MVKNIDLQTLSANLNENGYAVLPKIFSDEDCDKLASTYDDSENFRSVINMKRYQFGSGEYKYFKYPLPDMIEEIRHAIYPH